MNCNVCKHPTWAHVEHTGKCMAAVSPRIIHHRDGSISIVNIRICGCGWFEDEAARKRVEILTKVNKLDPEKEVFLVTEKMDYNPFL